MAYGSVLMEFSDRPTFHLTFQPTNQPMRTKAQVALTALEQALKITGAQEPKHDDEFTAAEYADKAEMNTEAARRLLHRYVKAGTLSLRKTPKGHFFSVV